MEDQDKNENVAEKIQALRDRMITKISKEIPNATLNGSKEKRSPNNVNFSFRDVEGEGLLLSLDMEGVACSTGSACSSGTLDPSHVLMALGIKPEQAHGSLRLTIGKTTTKSEINYTINQLKIIIKNLRKVSGFGAVCCSNVF